MKITLPRATLADALRTVAPTVQAKSTLPVLQCVRIAADEHVGFDTTDLSAHTHVATKGDIDEPGAVAVPHRLLLDLVSSVRAHSLTLATGATGAYWLRVTADGTNATVNGFDPDEMPDWERAEDLETVTVSGADFAACVNTVLHSASVDESRPALANVSATVAGGTLKLAATDGFRLAVAECPAEGADVTCLLPPDVLREVRGRAEKMETLTMHLSAARVVFECDSVTYRATLADAKFPDYGAIIPKTHTTQITVLRDDLAGAVKTALLFGRDHANIVTLELAQAETWARDNGGVLRVRATSTERGDYCEEVEVTLEGEALEKYTLNAAYVLQTLDALTGNEVTIELTQPTRPGLWTGDRDGAFCVVMPMHPPK